MSKNYFALLGITLIAFVSFLEYTVVNTALPTLQNTFHVSILNLQWVFNIYSIVVAIFMIVSGRIGDIYGRRLVFYLGALLLALGSLGAGLSNNFWELIFFRGVQSLGVAATVTLGSGLVTQIFQGKAHYPMAFYACLTGVGLAIGPFLGGVIVMHWGWRWIFYINIPLLIIAFAFCLPCLPESKAEKRTPIDVGGTILLAITLVSLIYGLIHGAQVGWTDPLTLILGLIFIIALPLLIKVENRQEYPIMNFNFFTKPNFLLAALACMMGGVLVSPSLLFSPLLLQNVLDYSPRDAGLILLTIPIAVVLFSPFIGNLVAKIGAKNTLFIALLVGFISALLHLIFAYYTVVAIALFAFFLVGLAWALNNVAAAISASSAVEHHQASVAIGTVYAMWNTSAAIMVAVTAVLFQWVSTSHQTAGAAIAFLAGFKAVFIFVSVAMIVLIGIGLVAVLTSHPNKST